MLLVIFGAGASHDSVDLTYDSQLASIVETEVYRRPPLASQLFDTRDDHISWMNVFREISPHVGRLRAASLAGGEAFERVLREIQSETELFEAGHRALMSMRFYLRAILHRPLIEWVGRAGGATNYSALLYQLAIWSRLTSTPLALLTFNYDVMLEYAATDVFGVTFDEMEDYVSDENVKLFFPHGSVRWVETVRRRGTNTIVPSDLEIIREASEVEGTQCYEIWDELSGGVGAPAVAIPTDASKTFVLPPDHLAAMRAALSAATRVLIVGWRGSEGHFHGELREYCADRLPCAIVDRDLESIAKVRLNLANGGVRFASGGDQLGYPGGFSAFVREAGFVRWTNGHIAGDPVGGTWS